jgi:hypothetical protein
MELPSRSQMDSERDRQPEQRHALRAPRRLREDPYEAMLQIAGEIGPRRLTSLAEAKAAAYLDGRLRRAGMSVSADPFRAAPPAGWEGLLLALPALLGVTLYFWLPLPSLLLAVWNAGLAAFLLRRGAPLIGRRRASQNVIATRPALEAPRWRIVLLAPLDSPPISGALDRALLGDGRVALWRLLACGLLALLATVGLLALPIEARRAVWALQFLPALYLALTAALELRLARAAHSPGAVSHAGALATLLAACEALGELDYVELWAAALGATATGAGAADMARRYPFDRKETLFIGLEGIGSGSLGFVTGGDAPRGAPADPLLLAQAHAAGADPEHEVGPRHYVGRHTLAGSLRGQGMRAIGVMCLDAGGRVPFQGSADDAPDQVEAAVLERAVRFVAALVRRFDQLNEP